MDRGIEAGGGEAMNHGPLVFLAAFFALAASWCGLVLAPEIQIGREQPGTNVVDTAQLYPQPPPGLARQGLRVYRANGCAVCHSQQIRQTGTLVNVTLTDVGTNPVAVAEALVNANVGITKASGPGLAGGFPQTLLRGAEIDAAKAAVKALNAAGAQSSIQIEPVGPDIARGWGTRRTVARDYLYDDPVMLGSQRVGPDLANVGLRLPDANWHLRHLYAPRLEVPGSPMPPYRFLFEERKIELEPSPDALQLPKDLAPPPGYEIVPRPAARALVAYLLDLHANTPLFEAPVVGLSASATKTNAPAK
jgi:cbb3-type cytochrome oxidase cytochrome c subunit